MSAIPATELFTAAALENPYPLYEQMRALAPVCAIGDTRAFYLCSHAAVEEAVLRHEAFSANLEQMLVCGEDDVPRIFDLRQTGSVSKVIATADEPVHAVHRRLLLKPLREVAIAGLEPGLRAFARARVAALVQAGSGDFCAALAEPLPAWVVIQLLGLEDNPLATVRRWAMMGGDFLAGRLEPARLAFVLEETSALQGYLFAHLDAVAARSPGQRGDSLTAVLCAAIAEELISREDAVGILVVLFGAAGESTASLLASALRLLAGDQTLQQRLRADPARIPDFIEEVVRLESPFRFHYRVVRQRTRLCGTRVEPGDLLLLGWAAANRDPAVWSNPDQLVLDRPRGSRHLGFGYGIHFCIGAALARLEVRVALEELLASTVSIVPDPGQPPIHVPSLFVRRLRHLHLKVA